MLLLLARTTTAAAIIVDGNPGEWPLAASVATSPQISSNPYLYADIAEVFFTNDASHIYWRIDTYADTNWTPLGGHFMQVCMNTDNDTTTGATSLGGCNVLPTSDFGFDYVFLINSTDSGIPTVQAFYCIGNDCSTAAPPVQVNSIGNVTEVGIAVANLGISGCTAGSGCVIPTIIFSETAANPTYNDWVPSPDNTFDAPIPGPTAINLRTIEPNKSKPLIIILMATGILISSMMMAVTMIKCRQEKINKTDSI